MPQKGLVAHDPGGAELRIGDEIEVLAECAVVIGSDGADEKEPITPRELLLEEDSGRDILDKVIAAGPNGGRANRLEAGGREFPPTRKSELQELAVVLPADGGLRRQGWAEIRRKRWHCSQSSSS